MCAHGLLVPPDGGGEDAHQPERTPLALGEREEQITRGWLGEAGREQGEAPAVARDDRVLLAGEGGEAFARHAPIGERGEEAVRADLLLDLGEFAVNLAKQSAARRISGRWRRRDLPSLA